MVHFCLISILFLLWPVIEEACTCLVTRFASHSLLETSTVTVAHNKAPRRGFCHLFARITASHVNSLSLPRRLSGKTAAMDDVVEPERPISTSLVICLQVIDACCCRLCTPWPLGDSRYSQLPPPWKWSVDLKLPGLGQDENWDSWSCRAILW